MYRLQSGQGCASLDINCKILVNYHLQPSSQCAEGFYCCDVPIPTNGSGLGFWLIPEFRRRYSYCFPLPRFIVSRTPKPTLVKRVHKLYFPCPCTLQVLCVLDQLLSECVAEPVPCGGSTPRGSTEGTSLRVLSLWARETRLRSALSHRTASGSPVVATRVAYLHYQTQPHGKPCITSEMCQLLSMTVKQCRYGVREISRDFRGLSGSLSYTHVGEATLSIFPYIGQVVNTIGDSSCTSRCRDNLRLLLVGGTFVVPRQPRQHRPFGYGVGRCQEFS